jgi:4-amino-4-deoxy-L-arabinose transferase-like glycosyltransferase
VSTPPPSRRERLALLALAALAVVLARLVGAFALESVPHVMDELAYALQAKTFASGHLTMPVHVPRGAFAMWFVDDRARTFSIFPPGWPAVLAIGEALGVAAWVNPLLHGATTLVVARIARRLGGARAGVLAAAIYATCPQAILLAASFMSHTLVALTAAVALAASLALVDDAGAGAPGAPGDPAASSGRRARAERAAHAAAIGAALGVAAATRPLCAVAIGIATAALLAPALARRRLSLRDLAVVVAPAAACVGLLLAYNHALTGHALRFPQTAFFDEHAPPVDIPLFQYHPGCNDLGFGPGHGCETTLPGGMHTLANALSNTGDNLTAWLFLAGGPIAFALALAALAGASRMRERLTIGSPIPLVIVLYGLYWYAGTCYGARFYHAALPSLAILAALGAAALFERRRAVAAAVLAAGLLWNGAYGARAVAEISHGYWGTDARFARLSASWSRPPALVLVAFGPGTARGRYALTTYLRDVPWLANIRALGALGANRPDLSGPVVFARYHPGAMAELRAAFPDRERWLYVMNVGRPDRLVRYEATGLEDLEAKTPRPRDDFDGYFVPEAIAYGAGAD